MNDLRPIPIEYKLRERLDETADVLLELYEELEMQRPDWYSDRLAVHIRATLRRAGLAVSLIPEKSP